MAADRRPRQGRPRTPASPCGSGSPPTRSTCGEPWLDPRLMPHVAALADPTTGLAGEDALAAGPALAGARRRLGQRRAAPTCTPRSTPRAAAPRPRGDFDAAYGDWEVLREDVAAHRARTPRRAIDGDVKAALRRRRARPGRADRRPGAGPDARRRARRWTRCAAIADDLRRRRSATTSPTWSTATSTSPTSATPAAGSARSPSAGPTPTRTRCRWTRSAERAEEAWAVGATEVCMQGGIHPDLPGTAYFDLVRAVKDRVPGHARARVLADGDRQRPRPHRAVDRGLADRGQGGRARHASPAPRPRSSTTRSAGSSPRASCRPPRWIEVVTTAHRLGHAVAAPR